MSITVNYLQRIGYPAIFDRGTLTDIFGIEHVPKPASDLVPSLAGGLSVSVSAGIGYVQGDTNPGQGLYRFFSSAVETRPFTAPATNPRWDLLVAQVFDQTEVGTGADGGDVKIIQGTPSASASATNFAGAPPMVASGSGYSPTGNPSMMPIALVLVPPSGAIATIIDKRPRLHGFLQIDTEESTTAVTPNWAYLPTPDLIRNLVVPAGAMLEIGYRAGAKDSVASNGRANIFLNDVEARNELPHSSSLGYIAFSTVIGNRGANYYEILMTSPEQGIQSGFGDAGGVYAAEWGTGQLFGGTNELFPGLNGGFAKYTVDPGVYDVGIKFEQNAAGTLTAKSRKLWVRVIDFSGIAGS